MGSGKTSVGKKLAQYLGFTFFDLDEIISDKEKMNIPEIFSTKGEGYFRTIETNILKELSERKKSIIALGGGALLRENNLNLIKKTGILIYLQTSFEEIFRRIKGKTGRPLIDGIPDEKERFKKIKVLFDQRKDNYLHAHMNVITDKKSIDAIAREIRDSKII